MAAQNILPDPNNTITSSGNASSGTAGPGYASVRVTSKQPIMQTRTNAGVLTSRNQMYHMWELNIKYNPLTEEEFLPIYSFLLEKESSLKPFKVALPQYSSNQDAFIVSSSSYVAGSTQLTVSSGSAAVINNAKVGDLFTVIDPNNSAHTKAYKVIRVETNADTHHDATNNTAPTPVGDERRITFIPPLAHSVDNDGTAKQINLTNPLIQVVQKGSTQQYELTKDGLYKFSLKLEEAQY